MEKNSGFCANCNLYTDDVSRYRKHPDDATKRICANCYERVMMEGETRGETPDGRVFFVSKHRLLWDQTDEIGFISIPIARNHGDVYHGLRVGDDVSHLLAI